MLEGREERVGDRRELLAEKVAGLDHARDVERAAQRGGDLHVGAIERAIDWYVRSLAPAAGASEVEQALAAEDELTPTNHEVGARTLARAREWDVVLAVDQSGSMAESVVYSSVMAAIFASIFGSVASSCSRVCLRQGHR